MENLLLVLHKIGDRINTAMRAMLGIASIALCIAVIGQFIMRWFGQSLPWASEFACNIFIWTTMLGSAVASRHLLHIGVDILLNFLHGKLRTAVLVLADIVLLFALILFVESSTEYAIMQTSHIVTTIGVSSALFYCSLPICGVIMMYYTFVQMMEVMVYGDVICILLTPEQKETEEVDK